MKHSLYGPSSLERRLRCPGSAHAEEGLADTTNVDAERGTRLHGIVHRALTGAITEDEAYKEAGEDASSIATCLEFVKTLRETRKEWKLFSEHRLALPYIPEVLRVKDDKGCTEYVQQDECGTADLLLVLPFRRVHVVDFKFTHKSPPPAHKNLQLGAYAVAACRTFDANGADVSIVLADLGTQSTAEIDVDAMEKHLRQIVEGCAPMWAPRLAGSHCQYCKAKMVCPALLSGKVSELHSLASSLAPSELKRMYDGLQPLAGIFGAIKAQILAVLNAGGDVPGFELKPGKNYRAWIDGCSPAELARVCELLQKTVDPFKALVKTELISPAQLEGIIGRSKAAKEAIAPLVTTRRGEPSLARKEEDSERSTEQPNQ